MLDFPETGTKIVPAGGGSAKAGLAHYARQQVELALETGRLPDTPEDDLFKIAVADKFLEETERARDQFVVDSAEVLHNISTARIGTRTST